MTNPSVAGPPTDPPTHTVSIPPWDLLNHGVITGGNPANKPKVVLETGPNRDDLILIDDD
jgi:hypothetical protein